MRIIATNTIPITQLEVIAVIVTNMIAIVIEDRVIIMIVKSLRQILQDLS